MAQGPIPKNYDKFRTVLPTPKNLKGPAMKPVTGRKPVHMFEIFTQKPPDGPLSTTQAADKTQSLPVVERKAKKFIETSPENPCPVVFEGEDFSYETFRLSQESIESDNEETKKIGELQKADDTSEEKEAICNDQSQVKEK